MGTSKITLSGGKIIGQVPYPFLKLHEGNGSYFFDKTAFSCMEYYEFASDTWITLFWEHNFKGFFLGKIPLLKRLQWRENFTLKAAYGTVNARNDGRPGKQSVFEAPMLFPAGMNTLDKPYVEMGWNRSPATSSSTSAWNCGSRTSLPPYPLFLLSPSLAACRPATPCQPCRPGCVPGGCPCPCRARPAPATPACPHAHGRSLRRHPLAGGGMSPRAAPARPATQVRRLRQPFCSRHPQKRLYLWTVPPFKS